MRRPKTELYVHCVWATIDRIPLISPDIERKLYEAIAAKCVDLDCDVVAIGGLADHVHVLVKYPASLSVSRLVKEVKGASSHLMNHGTAPDVFFKWQGAYGAFSVGARGVERVAEYIRTQKERHRDGLLADELEDDAIEDGENDS